MKKFFVFIYSKENQTIYNTKVEAINMTVAMDVAYQKLRDERKDENLGYLEITQIILTDN